MTAATTTPTLDRMGADDLCRRGREAQARMNAAHAEILSVIAEAERRALPIQRGCRTLSAWVEVTFKTSPQTASRWADAARRLSELPRLRDSFASGKLSFDQVRPAAQVATPETEQKVLAVAPLTPARALEREAADANRPSAKDAREAHANRFLRFAIMTPSVIANEELLLHADVVDKDGRSAADEKHVVAVPPTN